MKEKSLELYMESLSNIEKKLTNIFNEVMSGKTLLKRKIELRKECLEISLKLFKDLREYLVLSKKEFKKEKTINIIDVALAIGLTISSVAIMFFNPLISLLLLGLAMIKCVTKMNSLKTQIDNSKNELDDVLTKIDQISRVMDNIERRLSLDIKTNKEHDGELATKNIDLANDVILEFLETGNIKEIDNNIKLYVIKLLQSDLKDEENIVQIKDFDTLLKLAKDKVDRETKENGIKLVKGE